MNPFDYANDEIHCEGVPLSRIAAETGTPVYIYSRAALAEQYKALDGAFAQVPHLTCYSVKANSTLGVLAVIRSLGGGADIVSGGELHRCLAAGFDPGKIVYSGVGKTDEEIEYALKAGIFCFNCEGEEEFRSIDRIAGRLGVKAPIAIRVNPDIDPKTHAYIATGLVTAKFGIAHSNALRKYRTAADLPNLEIRGLATHIGSQILKTSPFDDAADRVLDLVDALRADGIAIRHLDLGGGLGITYKDEVPPTPEEYAAGLIERLKGKDLTLVLEPGRAIVGNAGALVTRVINRKLRDNKQFVIVDAGMNDLVRPSLYGAYHRILPVVRTDIPPQVVDIVGPICETSDFLATDREFPLLPQGALMAVMSAGAYGMSMGSNYNSRPRSAEVLVDGDRFEVVRRRETFADLTAAESIPAWIPGGSAR